MHYPSLTLSFLTAKIRGEYRISPKMLFYPSLKIFFCTSDVRNITKSLELPRFRVPLSLSASISFIDHISWAGAVSNIETLFVFMDFSDFANFYGFHARLLLTQKSTHWNPRASVRQAWKSQPSVQVNLT